jgi:lipid-binding SYLF domain-containing protein
LAQNNRQEEAMINPFAAFKLTAALVAALMLAGLSTETQAETCRVNFRIVKAGFIFGAGGGNGTLLCRGRPYALQIGGLSAGTIGVAAVDVVGNAYNLRRPADIAGSYTATGAGIAVIGGVKVATLQNPNGVLLRLRGVQAGLDLSLNVSGLTIAMR